MEGIDYTHQEGDVHSIIPVDGWTFVILYGFNDERERINWEPTPIYPDLERHPIYGVGGRRIVTFGQDPCEHFIPRVAGAEPYCGCCKYYDRSRKRMIEPCRCEKNNFKEIAERSNDI